MSKSKDNIKLYKNPDASLEMRVDDLVSRLTLEEKISQMLFYSSAIGRLGIHEYNWWNECLHGVARAGVATVFPQAIGMAASFNQDLLYDIASIIADEGRAKYNKFVRHDDRGIYKGLTYWTPNINIFRDPRWGRGQETYGEDPYLTSRLGVNFIKGLQGDHPDYMKAAACAKHFAVHSGPESERHEFDVVVSDKDLYETYLPAFRDAVKEAKVEAVMGAYNRVNGEPACASETLLEKILRGEWGFEGHVVSDCGAIEDIHKNHKVTETPEESAAMAVNNGCDLNCGNIYESLRKAVKDGLITEATINKAVKRLLRTRFKLGMFDPEELVPFNNIPYQVNDCEEHRRKALEIARESIVLLKNKNSLLPVDKDKIKNIAVIGPNADNKDVLLANYFGTPSKHTTILQGIKNAVNEDTRVYFAEGCGLSDNSTAGFAEAITVAEESDLVVMCLGLSSELEGEEGAVANSDGGGDKTNLKLPGMQEELLKAINTLNKPIVLVLLNGSPLEINWAHKNIPSIIEAWYPGEEGGSAVADVLFGDYNPGGRLPVTFVKSMDQLPPFRDYSMGNRTYRYLQEEPLYPFGYGLSYTEFEYSNFTLSKKQLSTDYDKEIIVSVVIENTGNISGDEVVQLYLSNLDVSITVPRWELKRFKRLQLASGEKRTVEFKITRREFAIIDDRGKCVLQPGMFKLYIGGQQPDKRSKELTGRSVLEREIEISGERLEIEY